MQYKTRSNLRRRDMALTDEMKTVRGYWWVQAKLHDNKILKVKNNIFIAYCTWLYLRI